MSRQFNSRNVERPIGVEAVIRQVPRCFDAFVWELYVDEVWKATLNDRAARRRLERGVTPPFCQECTLGYREKMLGLGRCHPPKADTASCRPSMTGSDAAVCATPNTEEAVHGF